LFVIPLSAILLSCGGATSASSAANSEGASSGEATSSVSSSPTAASSSAAASVSRETYDGIKVYCEASWTNIYAWVGENKLCGNWPGTALKSAGDWKYYEFPNIDFVNLIFNGSSGQTSDLSIDEKGVFYYYGTTWYDHEPSGDEPDIYVPKDGYPVVSEDNYRTFYQLLVYSFADGNGDGIGDFKGIIDHLDYLSDLGVEALWLSPVQPSDSYHSYDCTDYYSIKSSYEVTVGGTKYDFAKLLEACHQKGIKVVMDMVLNHTSKNHVWYSEHRDWYGNDNKFGFPEFDFDKTEVRNAIKEVGKYWLGKGVDGFRLDAAYWVYNSGANRDEKNFDWWQEFSHAMKDAKSDCYLIGEVLDTNHDLAFDYTACGFDSTFDFEAPRQTYEAFNGKASSFASQIASDQAKIDVYNPNAIMARALSNHDIGRFSQSHPTSSDAPYFIEDVDQYKIATALNALTPGNAYIYYGDELGLKATADGYQDQSYRTPMPFASGQTDSTVYFEGFHLSGKSTWSTLSGKSIAEDQADPYSAYSVLKNALAIKKGSEILQKGRVVDKASSQSDLIDYEIAYNGKSAHFYCNASSSKSLEVSVSGKLGDQIAVNSTKATLSGGTLTLPACSIAFIEAA
ncbi:MAG: starch-binding protein, partial [Bacilli bacterium]|nr:starch-binding protein [Bacilli bacterium]